MHKKYLSDNDSNSTKLSSRGVSIYYLGSAVFVIGIGLIIFGTALVMLFQLHYESEPQQILYTVVTIATGITIILIGINLMIRQTKKGYAIVAASTISSALAIFLFATNYLNNWYYPLVGYILGLYVIGFLALLGNSFANVIIWLIGNRPDIILKEGEKPRLYTDEEIQRDIEEATKKSIETAVAELQFELEDFPDDLVVAKSAPETPGNIIRVKDDINEVLNLRQTMTHGTTEKWGSLGIDKASMQLASTISKEEKKSGFFARLRERSTMKKEAKRLQQVKKKKEMERKKHKMIEERRKKMEAIKKEKELRERKIEAAAKKKLELKKAQREAIIKERELKKREIEAAAKKRLELKKAKKEAEIEEREAREKAILHAKNKKLEAKKALREAKLKKKKSSKKNEK